MKIITNSNGDKIFQLGLFRMKMRSSHLFTGLTVNQSATRYAIRKALKTGVLIVRLKYAGQTGKYRTDAVNNPDYIKLGCATFARPEAVIIRCWAGIKED